MNTAQTSPSRTDGTGPDWNELSVGEAVSLRHGSLSSIEGTIDASTADGATIWVISVPYRRQMIHVHDGYTLS